MENLEFYNPSLDIFIPIHPLARGNNLSLASSGSNLPTGTDITPTDIDLLPSDIDFEPTGIDITPTGELTPTGATPVTVLTAAIDLAATDLHRENPAETIDIATKINDGDWSIYYGLSDSLIPDLTGRPLLQLPTSYVVFNNYQPIFDDKQGDLRNIPSFEKHMLIIPMSSSLVYSIIAAYDNNTISFIGRPVETNGNVRQILFSYNPLPSRFTSKESLTGNLSVNKTYYNHSYNANTGQDDINIYDFANHAVWNGESFLEHETYFNTSPTGVALPTDEMILDETVEFAFFNIDNSISHGYTINVKNNPSPRTHLRVLY